MFNLAYKIELYVYMMFRETINVATRIYTELAAAYITPTRKARLSCTYGPKECGADAGSRGGRGIKTTTTRANPEQKQSKTTNNVTYLLTIKPSILCGICLVLSITTGSITPSVPSASS